MSILKNNLFPKRHGKLLECIFDCTDNGPITKDRIQYSEEDIDEDLLYLHGRGFIFMNPEKIVITKKGKNALSIMWNDYEKWES